MHYSKVSFLIDKTLPLVLSKMECFKLKYQSRALTHVRGGKAWREENDEWVWLSVDPMHSRRSWLTPYNYVQNNPVNLIDPTGMIDQDPEKDQARTGPIVRQVELEQIDVVASPSEIPQPVKNKSNKKSFFGKVRDVFKSIGGFFDWLVSWIPGKQIWGTNKTEDPLTGRDARSVGDPIELRDVEDQVFDFGHDMPERMPDDLNPEVSKPRPEPDSIDRMGYRHGYKGRVDTVYLRTHKKGGGRSITKEEYNPNNDPELPFNYYP